jgi:hypothetical protein
MRYVPEPPLNPPEPDIIGECAYCSVDLYDGCDYVLDRMGDEWYCDDDCYVKSRRDCGDIVTKAIEPDEPDERR